MSTPQSAVRDRTISVTKSGDAYSVADVPVSETLIEIEIILAASTNVQLPNGLAYAFGETAQLTVNQVDELDGAGEGVIWQNNGILQPVAKEGSPLSATLVGAGGDTLVDPTTSQYTATFTFANGDTFAYDETNSVAAGVVWASTDVGVATVAATGLVTTDPANGTCQITATFQGVVGISAVLTVT